MRRSCCPALPRMTRVPDVELLSVLAVVTPLEWWSKIQPYARLWL